MHLKANPINARVLKYLHVDAVSLGNNHVFDYGVKGFKETAETLEKYGIEWFGANNKAVEIEKAKNKIRLRGYCCLSANGWHYSVYPHGQDYLNTLTPQILKKDLEQDANEKFCTIVIPHWGDENTNYPRLEQIQLARELCSKYNTCIIASHPHVIQGAGHENGEKVAYSLGNFCFDQCIGHNGVNLKQTKANKIGLIAILNITDNEVRQIEWLPIRDTGTEIAFDLSYMKLFEKYSREIKKIENNEEYNQKRRDQYLKVHEQRFGKRNFAWLVQRLNFYSIGALLQRKLNERAYRKHFKALLNY